MTATKQHDKLHSLGSKPSGRAGIGDSTILYRITRGILKLAVGFYFSRIERFHAERVPDNGPVIFAANHPSALVDAFVIGLSVPRKVNFVGTVRMFRLGAVRWFLRHCGVIPINRPVDDPRAMRSVKETFDACYKVLEKGEAIGIFPEGLSHDDPQLKTVKAGTARMALEFEHRHGGRLGLRIVPVGLTFSAKATYRSNVLVHFGEPIRVADFLRDYPEHRRERIQELSALIEGQIEALMLHIPRLEQARVVEAVKRLYLARLQLGNRIISSPVSSQAGDLLLTQAIASAVDYTFQNAPDRAAGFVRRLDHYEQWLNRLRLSDETLARFQDKPVLAWKCIAGAALAVVGWPAAAYGWAHRLAPASLVTLIVRRYVAIDRNKTRVASISILAGIVIFTLFYAVYIWIFHSIFGWPASLWYALSLPVSGLIAYYYLRQLRRLSTRARDSVVLFRAHLSARRLLALRAELIKEIEAARAEFNRNRSA